MSTVQSERPTRGGYNNAPGTFYNHIVRPEVFLLGLDWPIEVTVFDKDILVKIDEDRRAHISLYGGDGLQTSGVYRAFLIKIVHKVHGEIDRQAFHWDAYEDAIGHNFHYVAMAKTYSWFVPDGGSRGLADTCAAIEAYIAMWR